MANSLQPLFHALAKRLRRRIAQVRDERELRLAYIDGVAEHFGVQRWGIYLLDEYRVEIAAIASAQFFSSMLIYTTNISLTNLHLSEELTLQLEDVIINKIEFSKSA